MSLLLTAKKIPFVIRPVAALLVLTASHTVFAESAPVKTAPTFDCASASHEIEILVCSDSELMALDHKMADVFKRAEAKNTGDDLKLLRAHQRGWIKGRNDCWKADDKRICTIESYNVRMVELQIQNGLVMVPTAIGYVCNDDVSKPFFATFYNNLTPQAAVITYADDQTIAIAAPAASGSKYISQGMSFWEHHGEATVEWYGTTLKCIPRK